MMRCGSHGAIAGTDVGGAGVYSTAQLRASNVTDIVADQQRDEVLSRAADPVTIETPSASGSAAALDLAPAVESAAGAVSAGTGSTRPPPGPRRPGTRWSVSTATASHRRAFRLSGNRADAEDLDQETFDRCPRCRLHPGTFEGWLHRITTNLFLDMVRRRARIRFDALPDDAADRLPSRGGGPEQAYAENHLDPEIQAALDSLPADFRAAVVLCDLEELSYEEIAATLSVKVGTVRSGSTADGCCCAKPSPIGPPASVRSSRGWRYERSREDRDDVVSARAKIGMTS